MGDGRYYTWHQFFSVGLLTALIISVCISFVYHYFRISKYKTIVSLATLSLLLTYLTEFTSSVAVFSGRIHIMYNLSQFFVYLHFFLCVLLLIIMSVDDYPIALPTQRYFYVSYIGIIFLVVLGANAYFLLECVMLLNLILLTNQLIEYRVSGRMFSSVKKMLNNYVFILNENYRIIYKNESIINAGYFCDVHQVDSDMLNSLFKFPIEKREAYHQQLIKVKSDPPTYLSYSQKQVNSKNRIAMIMTFTDITTLINLLDNLDKQRETVSKKNEQLIAQKDRVYEVERQKEIYALLDDIANRQQASMEALKKDIDKLNSSDNQFERQISALIKRLKYDLKSVRAAVSAYKRLE